MIIEIYNGDFEQIGQIQNISSFAWSRALYTASEFSIKSKILSPLWKIGNIVRYRGKIDLVGYIEQVTYAENEDGIEIEIRGRDMVSMLDWRVLSTNWTYSGNPLAAIAEIVTRELRGMTLTVDFPTLVGITGNFDYAAGTSLLACVSQIAEAYNIQLRYIFDTTDGVTLTGRFASTEVQGVFSVENGSLLSQEYDVSDNIYKNVVFASNGKDGDERFALTVGTATGNDRKEIYKQFDVPDGEDGEIHGATDFFPGTVSNGWTGTQYGFVESNGWYITETPKWQETYHLSNAGILNIDVSHECFLKLRFSYNKSGTSPSSVPPIFGIGKVDVNISTSTLDYINNPQKYAFTSRVWVVDREEGGYIYGHPEDTWPDGDITLRIPSGSHFVMLYAEAVADTWGYIDYKVQQAYSDGNRQIQALQTRAEVLMEHLKGVDAFSARINPFSKQMQYAVDYDLGNWVTVKSDKFGVSMLAQITNIIETIDQNGETLNVTFGKYYLTQQKRYELGV